ncbi:hypothetical protein B0H66DRAFT_644495 [Apodospora peruviana]|uniref:Peptidoglycan binding-like domain-containing protein n=1 Tax=Apodospora peruviana TaxID=516989 RepID=A0AAE0HST3_9PEZI|nr:hypothetical protein B0H66DRAFT_644495 [Apodospora peruviana]
MKLSPTSLALLLGTFTSHSLVLAAEGYCSTTSPQHVNIQSGGIVTTYRLDIPAISKSGKLSTNCIMNSGAKGTGVGQVQTACNECYGASLDVDNDYGSKTKDAVKVMQKKLGLKGSNVDGIYGPQTGGLMKFYGWSNKDWKCDRVTLVTGSRTAGLVLEWARGGSLGLSNKGMKQVCSISPGDVDVTSPGASDMSGKSGQEDEDETPATSKKAFKVVQTPTKAITKKQMN